MDRVEPELANARLDIREIRISVQSIEKDIKEIREAGFEDRTATRGERVAIVLGGSAIVAALISAAAQFGAGS